MGFVLVLQRPIEERDTATVTLKHGLTDVDAQYDLTSMQLTKNVIGDCEGGLLFPRMRHEAHLSRPLQQFLAEMSA